MESPVFTGVIGCLVFGLFHFAKRWQLHGAGSGGSQGIRRSLVTALSLMALGGAYYAATPENDRLRGGAASGKQVYSDPGEPVFLMKWTQLPGLCLRLEGEWKTHVSPCNPRWNESGYPTWAAHGLRPYKIGTNKHPDFNRKHYWRSEHYFHSDNEELREKLERDICLPQAQPDKACMVLTEYMVWGIRMEVPGDKAESLQGFMETWAELAEQSREFLHSNKFDEKFMTAHGAVFLKTKIKEFFKEHFKKEVALRCIAAKEGYDYRKDIPKHVLVLHGVQFCHDITRAMVDCPSNKFLETCNDELYVVPKLPYPATYKWEDPQKAYDK